MNKKLVLVSLPSAMVTALGKAGKRGANPFPSFAECHDYGTRQRIVLKK